MILKKCHSYMKPLKGGSVYIYLLYFNQLPPPRGRHASCPEMSESRLVKLKDIKKGNFPLYARKLWDWPQTNFRPPGFHEAVVFHNYTISSRSGVHPPGNAPCILPHKPPQYTPIMPHSPCLPDIQTSLLQAVLYSINPCFSSSILNVHDGFKQSP